MPDIYNTIGNDILSSPTGDILLASGADETNQRILRRLATNPGDYIFQTTYGAGIGRMVGSPGSADDIRGAIYGQMRMEDKVAQYPAPTVNVNELPGGVFADLAYYDAQSSAPFNLFFSVS